ncbi:MAG: DUF2971 domain-containing protein [Bacteroidetes bacterium]|nr:DUF2971 domain-containing protein [Bacteroidota bacterium]
MNKNEIDNRMSYLLNNVPILYQYMDVPDAKSLLKNSKILLKNSLYFNDPYDCFDGLIKFGIVPKSYRSNLINKQKSHLNRNKRRFEIKKLNKKPDSEIIKSIRDYALPKEKSKCGISCFSEKGDDLLMWSHYSNSHKGVCFGFDLDTFHLGLKTLSHQHKILLPINYSEEIIPLDFFQDELSPIINLLITKSVCWKYEKEIRLIVTNIDLKNKKKEFLGFDNTSISKIYLGCKNEEEKFFINFCKKNLPKVKIYKMQLNKNSFQLNPILINK